MRLAAKSRLSWAVTGVVVMLLLVAQAAAVALFFNHDGRALAFPYPLDYGEGPLLDQAMRLSRLKNIYRANLSTPPYVIANYPPLFVLAQAPFAKIFGPAFWYGRAISALSVVAAAIFIALTLRALTGDWLAAIAGGLTLPAIPYVLHWSPLCRVDSLALGLSWAGLFVIARWPDRRWSLVTTAVLLTAAAFTRQSEALAAPAAAFFWLLSRRPRRRAFFLAAMIAGIGLVSFVILNVLTGGGFFFNIVTANVNAFSWGEVRHRIGEILGYMPVLALGSGIYVLVAGWRRARSWWLATPYLIGAALSALTIGKVGSNVNYLFELSAAFSLVIGALIAVLNHARWARITLILLLALQVGGLIRWSQQDYYQRLMGKVDRRVAIDALMQKVHDAQGPVLADEYMGLIPLDGRQLYIQPFELTQLARAGVWNQQPFLDAIARKEFGAILIFHLPGDYPLHKDRWTEEQLDAIDAHYSFVTIIADTWIYQPQP